MSKLQLNYTEEQFFDLPNYEISIMVLENNFVSESITNSDNMYIGNIYTPNNATITAEVLQTKLEPLLVSQTVSFEVIE
jgi:hypothetical protein